MRRGQRAAAAALTAVEDAFFRYLSYQATYRSAVFEIEQPGFEIGHLGRFLAKTLLRKLRCFIPTGAK
jgi:hypothetical protein